MVSPCFVGVQAAIGPNLRFGEPMCVPAVLVFGVSDGLQKQPALSGNLFIIHFPQHLRQPVEHL